MARRLSRGPPPGCGVDDDRHRNDRGRAVRRRRRPARASRRFRPRTAPSRGRGREYAEAAAAAAGLAGLGVRRGDAIALWLSNRPSSTPPTSAATLLGAAPFSIYSTYTVEQAAHVVGDAGSRVLITEPAFLERALAVRERGAPRWR